jgi:hypothetical protein
MCKVWTVQNSTKAQALAELRRRGWTVVSHGRYSVEATDPNGHCGLYDPRDLLTELDQKGK